MTTGPNTGDKKRRRPNPAEARPAPAAQWDHERNLDMTPHDIAGCSRKKVWWRCLEPGRGHRWEATVSARTKGTGCLRCAYRRRRSTRRDTNQRPDGKSPTWARRHRGTARA